jgi:DNA-binding transcriptional LysR family regulator
MKKFHQKVDHLALDGHALRLFLAVLEEGSVTAAAGRLDLTQSAVSHALQKLARIVGAPLFVKSGRGIVATAAAHRLAGEARDLIDRLEAFARPAAFDPAAARLSLVIAANDFQADLLLPGVYRLLAASAARIDLRIIPSGSPTPELLRERRCDLVISPYPPAGTDILQRKLIEDQYAVFYDLAMRAAPQKQAEYLAARHITVVHSDSDRLEFDKRLEAAGIGRDMLIRVAGFAGVPSFLKGTEMIASLPSLLARGVMAGFGMAPVPAGGRLTRGMCALPLYMAWHLRDQHDPARMWLRQSVIEVAQGLGRASLG